VARVRLVDRCVRNGDLLFVDGEEEQGCGLIVEVGEVGAFEGGAGLQGRGDAA
jgi:hypothetical protein